MRGLRDNGSFNPSFCGFGIGGKSPLLQASKSLKVSILVSVDSVLEALFASKPLITSSGFNPSFCGFGIGGSSIVLSNAVGTVFQS